jgi:hypothetical protein
VTDSASTAAGASGADGRRAGSVLLRLAGPTVPVGPAEQTTFERELYVGQFVNRDRRLAKAVATSHHAQRAA